VGNIPDLELPEGFDCTEPTDLIVVTDGSVLFGVGYHSWLVSTKMEQIFLWSGGGADYGSPMYITSYRSDLGGVCAGLASIWVMARYGRIHIRSVRMVCDNEAVVKRCKQKLTTIIYHNTEGDWDLLKTYHSLRDEWCKDIPTKVQWVKGHADKEQRELTRDERLNIEAHLLIDMIWMDTQGAYGERPNCPHWPVKKATMFIQGTHVTSGTKKQLSSQLSEGKLNYYIIENEKWTPYTFDSVGWRDNKTAFKRLIKNR
jgi:hypothetical protein